MADAIGRILRVDHAGEHGAIAIYTAQLNRARRAYPDLIPWLEETLAHEKEHRARFRQAMTERAVEPCKSLVIWSTGGAALGAITASLGRNGIFVCTAAVERTVRRHLAEQAEFLDRADPALGLVVRDILVEEDAHLGYAQQHMAKPGIMADALDALVGMATETLIWLSTQGASFGFKRLVR